MARRQVLEIVCDRCGKIENQVLNLEEKAGKSEFTAMFQGKKIAFEDLCERCRKAINNYFEKIAREPKEEDAPKEEKKRSGFLSRVTG